MLDSIESVLDNAEECTGLLPTLDQLSALAGMHPTAWKPKFKVPFCFVFSLNSPLRRKVSTSSDPNLFFFFAGGNDRALSICLLGGMLTKALAQPYGGASVVSYL